MIKQGDEIRFLDIDFRKREDMVNITDVEHSLRVLPTFCLIEYSIDRQTLFACFHGYENFEE